MQREEHAERRAKSSLNILLSAKLIKLSFDIRSSELLSRAFASRAFCAKHGWAHVAACPDYIRGLSLQRVLFVDIFGCMSGEKKRRGPGEHLNLKSFMLWIIYCDFYFGAISHGLISDFNWILDVYTYCVFFFQFSWKEKIQDFWTGDNLRLKLEQTLIWELWPFFMAFLASNKFLGPITWFQIMSQYYSLRKI